MLDSIRGAGGISGLKKVDRSQIRDRSAAAVGGGGGGADTGPHGSGLPPAGVAPGGGMADALAAALQKRKEKVSRSGEYLFFFQSSLCLVIVWFGWFEANWCGVDDEDDDDDWLFCKVCNGDEEEGR
jgi:hypothetical protein